MERSCFRAMSTILSPGDLFFTSLNSPRYIVLVLGVSESYATSPAYNVACLYNASDRFDSVPSISSILGRLYSTNQLADIGLSGYKELIRELLDSGSLNTLRRLGISTDIIHSNNRYTGPAHRISFDYDFPEEMEDWLPYIQCLLKPTFSSSYPSIFL